jgi:hypothetical protein
VLARLSKRRGVSSLRGSFRSLETTQADPPFSEQFYSNILPVAVHGTDESTLLVSAVKSCDCHQGSACRHRLEMGNRAKLTDLDISLHVTGVGPLLTLGSVRFALLSCSSSTRSLDTWTDGHSSDKHMARRHSIDCNLPAKTKVIFLFSLGKNNLNREPEATKSTIA